MAGNHGDEYEGELQLGRLMRRLDALYPCYGFSSHVGYITPGHTRAVVAHGPCPQHRRSFQARAYGERVAA